MRQIWKVLIFGLLLSRVHADYIHEYTVDLYYANGVSADAKNISYRKWQIYSVQLKSKYPSLKQALKYGEAKLAYNASYLWGISDLTEVILQYRAEHPMAEIIWQALSWFGLRHTRVPGVCLRPLGHLSLVQTN